ncbi:NAD(P)-dependent dehydrogenase, short-chain alcohol dehydrogenase family [Solimonas aquatica]|uniref:NAD(P)-dependent dehydrogenase, short-chain alcohol dehydrogenase family n=1 Tax=Solimonas aquatica TaxID=489703 RepID=A0A1H9G1K5_9GAMM|nr:SDR family oxidoreductase [Solimonas aquatica]SEQ43971.1 NAD(P)-dependent dehydrogenase, short-chain alcohol dehydrogenase family [Solimonas aquatica]
MSAFALQGRLALVTGAASGIGAGIAQMLAEAGATVLIADCDLHKAQAQAEALRSAGHAAQALAMDLGDEASIVQACTTLLREQGTPWLLVNNAGLQDRAALFETSAEHWDRMLAVNTRGPFLLSREIARAMVAQGQGGRIVNIASAAVIGSIVKGSSAYTSSKAALLGLSRALALDLAEHAITVNTVLPGGVITPGAIAAKGPPAEGPARRAPPLGRCEPSDIGAAVLYFATPAAGRVSNQVLAVDGGWSLS